MSIGSEVGHVTPTTLLGPDRSDDYRAYSAFHEGQRIPMLSTSGLVGIAHDETHEMNDGAVAIGGYTCETTSTRTAPIQSPTQDGRAAIEKACELLAAFTNDSEQVLGVTELARRTGLTKSTAHRQLGILQRTNMIERCGRGYRIGSGLRALARSVADDSSARVGNTLLPYLVELFEVTRYTAQLAVLEGTDVVYIGKVSGHHSVSAPSRIGARLPAHGTAGGKLLLAHHPRAAAEVLAAPLRRLTPRTVGTRAQLVREFDEIRRRGVAVDHGGADVAVSCIASAVVSPRGEPMAAMSVCAPTGSNITAVSDVLSRITLAASRHVLRTTGRQR